MPSDQSRRRLLAGVGGALLGGTTVVFGSDAAGQLELSDPSQLGGDGLTAGTIPASTDTLLVVHTDRDDPPNPVGAVGELLADRPPFDSVPERLLGVLSSSGTASVDPSRVGKIALVVDGDGHGGAVVWADWDLDFFEALVAESGSEDTERGRLEGQRTYTVGDTVGAVLADTAFAVGHADAVADTLGVWHGRGDPVADPTLSEYDRTRQSDPARFSLGDVRLPCDCLLSGEDRAVYDRIGRLSGSIDASGRLRVSVGTGDGDAQVLASALRTDLGLTDQPARVEVPPGATESLTVQVDGAVVRVTYDPTTVPQPASIRTVLGGLSRLVTDG